MTGSWEAIIEAVASVFRHDEARDDYALAGDKDD